MLAGRASQAILKRNGEPTSQEDGVTMENAVSYQIHGRCAVVTLNNPRKLNALTSSQFYDVATFLRDIDKIEDVIFTILTGTGRFFSA